MTKPDRRKQLSAIAVVVALSACGDDSSSPSEELTFAQVVAQCARGTIGNATAGVQQTGRVDAGDCIPEQTDGGRIEGWRLPQSSFGSLTELEINLSADFDAVLVILGPNGTELAASDQDIGGDLGREQLVLQKNLDATLPQYFIGVFSYPDEPAGDYQLTIGPSPVAAVAARAPNGR